MDDGHLDKAVNRIDAALARIEAAVARSAQAASQRRSPDIAALAALEQRHAALRKVMTESVSELDTLLAAAESAQPSASGQ